VDVWSLGVSFGSALATALLVVVTAPLHRRWSGDVAGSGVQKHHHGVPPRVGLLALAAGTLAGYAWLVRSPGTQPTAELLGLLVLCSLPAALMGLLEDVTRRVRARWRLLAPAVGALMGMGLLGTLIPSLGVPPLDPLMQWAPAAVAFTLLMMVGFTQAVNILDGLNGLASGNAILMFLATAAVAFMAKDGTVTQICLVLAAATAGFWLVNFPAGKLFLGDGGAYFLGFVVAQLWVLLLIRNPAEVSPWCVMLIAAYPTAETVFSILRRKVLTRRARNATAPDRLHLHTLMLRRRTRPFWAGRAAPPWAANASASALLLLGSMPFTAAAALAPSVGWLNFVLYAAAGAAYVLAFRALLRAGRRQTNGRRPARSRRRDNAESRRVRRMPPPGVPSLTQVTRPMPEVYGERR
jgi:UDP-N-acetylmuramyl pentapeptide phosphotransferase/UDP-N-acetylglucosamine-1-phosphate transferase